jgi:tRNA uridine 5-carboxymethylaminomethyl modification enzyme
VKGLRNEARETLKRVQPIHLGQIGRLPGITPADLSILFVAIKGFRKNFPPIHEKSCSTSVV